MKLSDRMEAIVVFLIMTFIFLPIRFAFVTYVTDEWFGSFGIVSAIAVAIVVLSKKHKLGVFGEMFQRQMIKVHTGKRRKLVYTHMGWGLFAMGLLIMSINLGNTTYIDQKNYILQVAEEQGQSLSNAQDMQRLTEELKETSPEDMVKDLIQIPILLVYQFPYFTALWAIENDLTEGFLLHFSTVAFVEVLEMAGVLAFYRFTLKSPKTPKIKTKEQKFTKIPKIQNRLTDPKTLEETLNKIESESGEKNG